ncbi:MAG: hypothetical protein FD174_154 [Geobacteraceae bacterium]|nr:MAG: hypothetical protein FD174_154 [Geobacteraceae bacterium]
MHTDPVTGKRPYLLGLKCRHGKGHINQWFIREESNDNKNGVIYRGKGPAPDDSGWVRDSRKVEIIVKEPNADWNTALIRCKSEQTGEERIVTPIMVDLKITGIPATLGDNANYPSIENGKGRCFRFDASKLFPGTVTVFFTIKNKDGKVIRDLSLRYYDIRDFAFSATGPDGISDDKILQEDVLTPVKRFLEEPKNARPDGTLLKEHILYIVVVHGLPYSANGIFGIDHGATANKGDHGSLASLEQRLQTLYYGWDALKPPLIPFYMAGGPDADKGVVNHIITTALRHPLTGSRWNPYMHPDTYYSLRREKKPPEFHKLPSFSMQRKEIGRNFFAYGVSRIDGANPEEAKRLVDYAVYATAHLRPEIDCRVRSSLAEKGGQKLVNLSERLAMAEKKNLWGERELLALGFFLPSPSHDQGLPFLARSEGESGNLCSSGKPDWGKNGFYPGGMGRKIISDNGLNFKKAEIWRYLNKGVTVTAAGAPAYSGGPHITNATFWDNAILTKYLLRGRDLGECFLRATLYVNWSTSLIGDPLYHPDLNLTTIDSIAPKASDSAPDISFEETMEGVMATVSATLLDTDSEPEVAVLTVHSKTKKGEESVYSSPLFSRRPQLVIEKLQPDTDYTIIASLTDPYGNTTTLPSRSIRTPTVNYPMLMLKDAAKKLFKDK